jgi:hypothetical protein
MTQPQRQNGGAMKSKAILVATLLSMTLISTVAPAQDDEYQWANRDLLERGVQNEQYISIGKGALAYCKIEATSVAQQSVKFPDCNAIMNSGHWSLVELCSESNLKQLQDRVQAIYTNVFRSCMANKGWFWVKVR